MRVCYTNVQTQQGWRWGDPGTGYSILVWRGCQKYELDPAPLTCCTDLIYRGLHSQLPLSPTSMLVSLILLYLLCASPFNWCTAWDAPHLSIFEHVFSWILEQQAPSHLPESPSLRSMYCLSYHMFYTSSSLAGNSTRKTWVLYLCAPSTGHSVDSKCLIE